MHQLVYMSRAKHSFSEAQLLKLCKSSSTTNAEKGITGLLLYDGTRFIQALEGPRPEVDILMRAIMADPRHTEISIMADKPIDDRQFGDWGMNYQTAPSGCCSQDFLEKVKSDVTIVQDSNLQAAFIGFALLGNRSQAGYRCTAG